VPLFLWEKDGAIGDGGSRGETIVRTCYINMKARDAEYTVQVNSLYVSDSK